MNSPRELFASKSSGVELEESRTWEECELEHATRSGANGGYAGHRLRWYRHIGARVGEVVDFHIQVVEHARRTKTGDPV